MVRTLITAALLQTMPVPPSFQAALFQKLLHYDSRARAAGGTPRVLLVHGGALEPEDTAVLEALGATGLVVTTASAGELDSALPRVAAAYVRQPQLAPAVARACEKHGVLSLTGVPRLVEQGLISVGIDQNADGRPQIVINRGRLAREGHELAAQLLGLSRIID